MVRASSVDLSPTSGTDADWYFWHRGWHLFGTRGEVGTLKFYGLTGVGADSSGNIYVNLMGSTTQGRI